MKWIVLGVVLGLMINCSSNPSEPDGDIESFCMIGDRICSLNDVLECDSNRSWKFVETCSGATVCVDGICIDDIDNEQADEDTYENDLNGDIDSNDEDEAPDSDGDDDISPDSDIDDTDEALDQDKEEGEIFEEEWIDPNCLPDQFGNENDSADKAAWVDLEMTYSDLQLCSFDHDWFETGPFIQGDGLGIDIMFSHEVGDIDLKVFAMDFTSDSDYIAAGFSKTDNESVRVNLPNSGTYLFTVYNRRTPVDYELSVHRESGGFHPLGSTCNQPFIWETDTLFEGDTSLLFNNYEGSCSQSGGSDAVFVISSRCSGNMRARLNADYDSLMYLRSGTCENGNSEIACADEHWQGEEETLEVPINQGTYFLFVDGFSISDSGTFELQVELPCRNSYSVEAQ